MTISKSISLAILKKLYDQSKQANYIAAFLPFVEYAIDKSKDSFTSFYLQEIIRKKFFIDLPIYILENNLLTILIRKNIIGQNEHEKSHYFKLNFSYDNKIDELENTINKKVDSIIKTLKDFFHDPYEEDFTYDEIEVKLFSFIDKYSLNLTPTIDHINSDEYIISEFIEINKQSGNGIYKYILELQEANILINSIKLNHFMNASKVNKQLIFCLDTQVLLKILGTENKEEQTKVLELLSIIKKYSQIGLYYFEHNYDELKGIFERAKISIETKQYQDISWSDKTIKSLYKDYFGKKADLMIRIGNLQEELAQHNIYLFSQSVDIRIQDISEDKVIQIRSMLDNARGEKTIDVDYKSLANIYYLRKCKKKSTINEAGYLFLCSNPRLCQVNQFYDDYISEQHIPLAITIFDLITYLWIKEGKLHTSIQRYTELLNSNIVNQTLQLKKDEIIDNISNIKAQDETIIEYFHKLPTKTYIEAISEQNPTEALLKKVLDDIKNISSEQKKKETKLKLKEGAIQEYIKILEQQKQREQREQQKQLEINKKPSRSTIMLFGLETDSKIFYCFILPIILIVLGSIFYVLFYGIKNDKITPDKIIERVMPTESAKVTQ